MDNTDHAIDSTVFAITVVLNILKLENALNRHFKHCVIAKVEFGPGASFVK